MTIDRYTKAVLTVIAACLLWLCVNDAAPRVAAQATYRLPAGNVQAVVIVGTGMMDSTGAVTMNLVRRGNLTVSDPTIPVTAANPLPVSLPYTPKNPLPAALPYTTDAPLAIEIAAVRKVGPWEPIRAHVEDAPTRPKPGGGR